METQEKSLINVNEKSIFYKIKNIFRKLFHKEKEEVKIEEDNSNVVEIENKAREKFMENIRDIETEETKTLELWKRYRKGEIKEQDLTNEQIEKLCKLYDEQIQIIRKSNEIRKQKLLEYRKNMKSA